MSSKVNELLSKATNPLVIISRPDDDSVGSGLAVHAWYQKQNKSAKLVSFLPIVKLMGRFDSADIAKIEVVQTLDFSHYDLVILLDSSGWIQFFGNNWREYLPLLDLTKVVLIDHHEAGEIAGELPAAHSVVHISSSTAQVFYEHIFKSSGVKLDVQIAEYLYLALVGDTQRFRLDSVVTGTYQFAEELIAAGVDHSKCVDYSYDLESVKFTGWALNNTEFISKLKTTLLIIDPEKLAELDFSPTEADDYYDHYKETVQRVVENFDYGIILLDQLDGTIKLRWRTRNYGDTIDLIAASRAAGFDSGGHRNAGGGIFNGTISLARSALLDQITIYLSKLKP